jgi:hypothetical protein
MAAKVRAGMAKQGLGFLDGVTFPAQLRRWSRAARLARDSDLARLQRQRGQAMKLRQQLDRLIRVADERLDLPRTGAAAFPRPHNADWAWRPNLWRGQLPQPGAAGCGSKTPLGSQVTLYHDCDRSELSVRQMRNLGGKDLAPFGLRVGVFHFSGSFLSLAVDLPAAGAEGLNREHIIRMDAVAELERPLEIFARLNVRNGPNTEQIVRELPRQADQHRVEFDLAYAKFNEKRVDRVWVDIIFDSPQMNEIILRDLTFSRRPRAQI